MFLIFMYGVRISNWKSIIKSIVKVFVNNVAVKYREKKLGCETGWAIYVLIVKNNCWIFCGLLCCFLQRNVLSVPNFLINNRLNKLAMWLKKGFDYFGNLISYLIKMLVLMRRKNWIFSAFCAEWNQYILVPLQTYRLGWSESSRGFAIVNGSILSQYGPIYDRKTPGLWLSPNGTFEVGPVYTGLFLPIHLRLDTMQQPLPCFELNHKIESW